MCEIMEEIKRLLRLNNKNRLLLGNTPMILTTRKFIAEIQKKMEEYIGYSGAKVCLGAAAYEAGFDFAKNKKRFSI